MLIPDAEVLFQSFREKIREKLTPEVALVGIHSGGAWIAERLQTELEQDIPVGTLDISFYRDDFSRIGLHPQVKPSHIPFEIEGKHIILIDDVLYTGRTTRAAMNELFDYGRPSRITLATLIDRGDRELPIYAEIVGAEISLNNTQNLELLRDTAGKFTLKLHEAA